VSIKGRDYTWFRKALEHGDLATVRSSVVDLPPLTLGDALSVALLICDRRARECRPRRCPMARKLLERPGVTLPELRQALDAFAVLVEDGDRAQATLTQLAEKY
jgi:hypothetical protein